MKKYFVRIRSEYEFVLGVEEDSELEAEELAWEQDWSPLIHNAEIDEMYQIE